MAITMACCLMLAASSCSSIAENNDPILGTWSITKTFSSEQKGELIRYQEWIFNDVYLGRFQIYENGELIFHHDYDWKIDQQGNYIITYRGNIDLQGHVLQMVTDSDGEMLKSLSGEVFAMRK